jgi:3D (Asp-Asp-Asp) domain-containing protein
MGMKSFITIVILFVLCIFNTEAKSIGFSVYNTKCHVITSNHTFSPNTHFLLKSKKDVSSEITKEKEPKAIKVRLTTYWASGAGGSDYYSRHLESSTGVALQSGISAAVDPNLIPYGSHISLPDGHSVVAVDTGSDVISRKASHGRLPVIDLFFRTEREAMYYINNNPAIVDVIIE